MNNKKITTNTKQKKQPQDNKKLQQQMKNEQAKNDIANDATVKRPNKKYRPLHTKLKNT